VTVLQFKVVLVVVRLCSPRAQSIEVLSHREEVGYSLRNQVVSNFV
jgi:hypothetical protein